MRPQPTRNSIRNRMGRIAWGMVHALLYRPSPVILHGWRRFLLRCFGASVGPGAHPYPTARVWAPWNLTMERDSCLGHRVDCYSVAPITIGERAVVSQYAYLCAASHDYQDADFPLTSAPIAIGPMAWIAAGAFVGPGVMVGDGAVVGARSVVFKDVPSWTVVAGNPARVIKHRLIQPALAERASARAAL
jgi:putative colanic acid biosynthesis acetyltransferase WcaF